MRKKWNYEFVRKTFTMVFFPFTLCSLSLFQLSYRLSISLGSIKIISVANHFNTAIIKWKSDNNKKNQKCNREEKKSVFWTEFHKNTNLIMHKCFKLILEQQCALLQLWATSSSFFLIFIWDLENFIRIFRMVIFRWINQKVDTTLSIIQTISTRFRARVPIKVCTWTHVGHSYFFLTVFSAFISECPIMAAAFF